MPFFTRVFRGKDSSSKKHANTTPVQENGVSRPKWTDAWARSEVAPSEVQELLRACTKELKARALATPLLLLPFRPSSNPSAARSFIRNYFKNTSGGGGSQLHGDDLAQELRLAEPMVLCSVIKWCWSRLPGGVVTWDAYELFKIGEQDSGLAHDAFSRFIPMSVESDARTRIIFDFFDLLAAIAAHSKSNGLGGRKLSRYAGWWAFEQKGKSKGFEEAYNHWALAADATSHLFFAYLRSISPEATRGVSISTLPLTLQSLLKATEYPPVRPSLLQVTTTKVAITVETVSPTPFALLRRVKNFEYRDSDHHLQEFSHYEDPAQALTDECLRVLKCISNANQSNISSTKTSTSLRDAAWSRFEDVGFGAPIESDDDDDDKNAAVLAASEFGSIKSDSVYNAAHDLNRPSTPSWADFLTSGFTGTGVDGNSNGSVTPSYPITLLPPDKILPPIPTSRGQSSQSHKRGLDDMSTLEPGELASITDLELDDSFWWVWISSLAGEEPDSRKAVFGRCALVETVIKGAKWLIIEEKIKGAVPEIDPSAYIAEKNRGFFSLGSRRGKMSRAKSTKLSKTISYR